MCGVRCILKTGVVKVRSTCNKGDRKPVVLG